MNLEPKFKQSKGIENHKATCTDKVWPNLLVQSDSFTLLWFPQTVCGCTTALASVPEGFLHFRCDHRQKPTAALPFPELSSAVHEHCWVHSWLQTCPGGQRGQAGSVVGVTVLHQVVGDVAAVKDTFVVAFLCKRVHCPGNHLNSSGRPVPHIVPARNKEPERSPTLHTAEAGSAEATAEFWSCTSIASRNNSVSPSATSAFSVFLL